MPNATWVCISGNAFVFRDGEPGTLLVHIGVEVFGDFLRVVGVQAVPYLDSIERTSEGREA